MQKYSSASPNKKVQSKVAGNMKSIMKAQMRAKLERESDGNQSEVISPSMLPANGRRSKKDR